jgi:carboxymethylenebutenolidase
MARNVDPSPPHAIFGEMKTLSHGRIRLHHFLVCIALAGVAPSGFSQVTQATQATQAGATQSWADQQKAQAWATRKLDKSPRHQQWVQINQGGRTLSAWVDYPEVQGKVPVILVLHEVFGLTDSTRNTADHIAAMGYIVIAPDMLSGFGPSGGDTRSFPSSRTASQTLTALQDEVVSADLDAWADYGKQLPGSNGKLALVGLSWGGGAAFRYATTQRKDVKAMFVFYDVGPPAITQGPDREKGLRSFPIERINVPVYGFYPDKDTRVMSSLQATKDGMAAAGKVFEPVIYQGAEHAYMRVGEDPADSNPANAAAVKASLARLQKLLRVVLH